MNQKQLIFGVRCVQSLSSWWWEMRAKSSACEITSPPCSRRSHSHVCHWVKYINSFTARIGSSTFPSSRRLFYRLLSISDFLEGLIFFLSMAQLQQGGQRALPAEPLSAFGDSLFCQGVVGFEPAPTGDNAHCLLSRLSYRGKVLLLRLKGCFSCFRGKNWRIDGKDRKGGVHLVLEPRLWHSALYQ